MLRRSIPSLALLLAVACVSDKGDKDVAVPTKPQMTEEQAMQKMAELAVPGPEHKRLDPLVGKFGATTWFKMAADGPEQTSTGTTTNEWILDGRFLQQRMEGSFQGTPFHGIGITGFNNATKRYEGFWIDSMGTMMMPLATGTANSTGKVITFSRTMLDPIMNQMITTREVLTIVDDNRHTFEWYQPGPDGKEFRMMHAEYVRAR